MKRHIKIKVDAEQFVQDTTVDKGIGSADTVYFTGSTPPTLLKITL